MKYPLVRQNGFTDREKTQMLAKAGVNVKGETQTVIAYEFNRVLGS